MKETVFLGVLYFISLIVSLLGPVLAITLLSYGVDVDTYWHLVWFIAFSIFLFLPWCIKDNGGGDWM